jgi:phage tail-like protein
MAVPGLRIDPFTTHSFSIEIGHIQHALFSEFSGLQAEVDVFPYPEGGCNDYVHKLPGRTKESSNITLKRGVAYTDELWLWFEDVMNGSVTRKSVSVILYHAAHIPVKRWNFSNAFPVKWVGPAFKAGENAISIETLELAHEGMSTTVNIAVRGVV